jgi:hypothetical protein
MQGRGQNRNNGDFKALPVIVSLTAASPTYQMKVTDTVVWATSTTGSDDTGIIYMPPLSEAIGQVYCVVAPSGATNDDISLYYCEADADTHDLDADGDAIVLFSTGAEWLVLATGI